MRDVGRRDLTDHQWQQLEPFLPAQKPRIRRPGKDHRTIINGVLWVLRTGVPWRDLPERYGPWRTVASRFYRWRKKGLWDRLLAELQQKADAVGQLSGTSITWMAPSFGRISMLLAPKKGGRSGARPLPRRIWNESPSTSRRYGQACGLRSDTGAAA